MEQITVPGRNCWCHAAAGRVAFLVDTAAYFRAFRQAALRARHSILIVGWDVHSKTPLQFDPPAEEGLPNELGALLDHLATNRPGLQIRVLDWDSPLILAGDRQFLPQAHFDWFTHANLCFALDAQHPIGGSQHQKLVIVDDSIAFVGGADITLGRLDDCSHTPDDPRRPKPDGGCFEPYHDVQMAVDGAAARALGRMARERWALATGERLMAPRTAHDTWPHELAPEMRDVEVAIARTLPRWKGRQPVHEVEALFLDSIAAARDTLYLEAQYFTAQSVARTLLARLEREDCPEVVMVLPRLPTGWLEQSTMGLKQRLVLARLRAADRGGRLHVYMPMTGPNGDCGVSVHSKVTIVDERFVRVGSANLNNRSMGLDSECDLAIEAAPGSDGAAAIVAFRNRLVSEHLGVGQDVLAQAIGQHGGLVGAIEALRGEGRRSLVPFPAVEPGPLEAAVGGLDVLDPAEPALPERVADALAREPGGRSNLRVAVLRLGVVVVVLLALTAAWHWGPLAELADPETLAALSAAASGHWMGIAVVLGLYLLGSLVMFPIVVLIAATGLLYGPLTGLGVAAAGSLLGAVAGYAIGAMIGRDTLQKLTGRRIDRLSRQLARRGVLAMTVIRLLPLLPFTLVNLAAGASHLRFRDFVLGTLFGMAPGIAAMTLFSGQLARVLQDPDPVNVGVLAGIVLAATAAGLWSLRRFGRGAQHEQRPQGRGTDVPGAASGSPRRHDPQARPGRKPPFGGLGRLLRGDA